MQNLADWTSKALRSIAWLAPGTCRRCGSSMRILAVITEPHEVRKILRHLVKIGRGPPGVDLSFV